MIRHFLARVLSSLACFAVAIAPAWAQGEFNLVRFVHPNAKTLLSVNWSRIAHSQFGTMLREQLGPNANMFPGIEFLDSVDRFLISSPGVPPGDESPEAPVLIAIGGHFDLAKVRASLLDHAIRPQAFNSFQVYRPQAKNAKDLAFVLYDTRTILVGDSRSIFATLERNAFPQAPPAGEPNSMLARAAEMESVYEAWALVTAPSALGSNRLSELLSGRGLDAEPQGFEAGFSMRNGLAADITILVASEGAAKSLNAELTKMIRLAAKDKANEGAIQDFEKKVKFSTEGARVKVSLRMTQQEVEKAAQAFAAGRAQAAKRSSPLAPPTLPHVTDSSTAPAPPVPPGKQVIRIEGLDDGPREIPYSQR